MPNEPKQLLYITIPLLQELSLLFESGKGGLLPDGEFVDAGFNCHAKSFVTAFLAGLQGIPVDLCGGSALLVRKTPHARFAYLVRPNAWAGVRSGRMIDLSMNRLENEEYFTTGHQPLKEVGPMEIKTTFNEQKFDWHCRHLKELPSGTFLFFHLRQIQPLSFEWVKFGTEVINSQPTREIGRRYKNNNVLAKAILHLHLVLTGERQPLRGATQAAAWDTLANWSIDAVADLERRWRSVGRGEPWRLEPMKMTG